jgi:hypothetical protein
LRVKDRNRSLADPSRSQQQISKLLEIILRSDTLKSTGGPTSRTARLGSEGQRVLDHLKDVLQAFKAWGEEKNGDDILQNLLVGP